MKTNFSVKFSRFGITCGELTGDVEDMRAATRNPIVCATPEKVRIPRCEPWRAHSLVVKPDTSRRRVQWDTFSRKWETICEATKLVLIDEVHMLNEDRGATLEACVARLRTRMPNVRLIAASATISNPLDLSEWLGVSSPLIFGAEFRPVPLQTIVQCYPKNENFNEFLFDKRLTNHLGGVIQQHSSGRPTLVFCATRNGAQQAAQTLASESQQLFRPQSDHDGRLFRLRQASQTIENPELRTCVLSGVGFHSAALRSSDRATIERLFKSSDLVVVCTTTTLSQGVNLPAHLVVVKSTLQWRGAGVGYQEYSPNMLRQMIGRAGRPQFDTHGKAVIMTAQENGQKYRALADSQEVIESQIAPRLCDAINSEIAGGLIHDVGDLMLWINKLYLSVRFRKNPGYYDPDGSLRRAGKGDLDAMLQELCMQFIRELSEYKMITSTDGFCLAPTQTGQLISRHYIRFATMKTLSDLKQTATLSEIIEKLSYAAEFESMTVKQNEKRQLKELNTKILFKRPARAGTLRHLTMSELQSISD